jgi:hypothetical protein
LDLVACSCSSWYGRGLSNLTTKVRVSQNTEPGLAFALDQRRFNCIGIIVQLHYCLKKPMHTFLWTTWSYSYYHPCYSFPYSARLRQLFRLEQWLGSFIEKLRTKKAKWCSTRIASKEVICPGSYPVLHDASAGNRTRGWPTFLGSEDLLRWQRPILPLNHQCCYHDDE